MIPNRRAFIEMTVGLLVMAGTIQAATFINTCPVVITSPGDYLLSADLICGAGSAISILSSNVTLKFQGHSITAGFGAIQGVVVNPNNEPAGLENVRILGPGLITNNVGNVFGTGVDLLSVNHSEVSGITVRGARGTGIGVIGGTDLTITANALVANAIDGIFLYGVLSSTISGNEASGNNGDGIRVTIPSNMTGGANKVIHNICNGNLGSGVVIDGANVESDPAMVQDNVTNGNGQYGIVVFPPAANVTHNTAEANGMFDLFDSVPGCTGTLWSGNTFLTANQSCIH